MEMNKMNVIVFVCTLFGLMTSQTAQANTGTTSCTAPPVQKGESIIVTCDFGKNISTVLPVAFNLEQYPSKDNSNEVTVLDCNWINTDQPQCQPSTGYTFDGRTLRFVIDNASERHTGRYACKAMSEPYKPDPTICTFNLTAVPITTPGDNDCRPGFMKCAHSVQCINEEKICDGENDCNDESDEDPKVCESPPVSNNILLYVGIAVTVILVVIAVIIVGCFLFKRYRGRQNGNDTQVKEPFIQLNESVTSSDPNTKQNTGGASLNDPVPPKSTGGESSQRPHIHENRQEQNPESEADSAGDNPLNLDKRDVSPQGTPKQRVEAVEHSVSQTKDGEESDSGAQIPAPIAASGAAPDNEGSSEEMNSAGGDNTGEELPPPGIVQQNKGLFETEK